MIFEPRQVEPEVRDPRWADMSDRQYKALRLLNMSAEYGVTADELAVALHTHRGSSSGLMSTLHKRGIITRLVATRTVWGSTSSIYVLPEYVLGCTTVEHGSVKKKRKKRNDALVITYDPAKDIPLHYCPNCGNTSWTQIPPSPPPVPFATEEWGASVEYNRGKHSAAAIKQQGKHRRPDGV